ncbi:MAG: DDE-type integrase/transposase/recombinase [Candidatus Diapherotrites archaeon]
MAYSLRKKRWYVKQMLGKITPITEISRNRKVPRKTLYRWLERYKKEGWEGLENKAIGRIPIQINKKFDLEVVKHWGLYKFGSHKTWLELRKVGFDVSERQIQKVFNRYGFRMNKRKRPSQIKFVKYEWPKPNMLWHTDWTTCPFTGMQLIAFIDDHSRYIVHAEYFSNATTENTLLAFNAAIKKYGIPGAILTDNGAQFTPARAEKGPFTRWCEEKGIKHILGRIHHPQTNGKIERWFGTYKTEFDERFSNMDEYLIFYNERRIHQGINYQKPIDRYECDINSV